MGSDPFLDGKIPMGVADSSIGRAIGRIEGHLEGIRSDIQAAAETQKELTKRLDRNECRVDSLEAWRELLARYEKDRRNRNRAVGVIGLTLLVPSLGWAAEVTHWIYQLLNRPPHQEARPAADKGQKDPSGSGTSVPR